MRTTFFIGDGISYLNNSLILFFGANQINETTWRVNFIRHMAFPGTALCSSGFELNVSSGESIQFPGEIYFSNNGATANMPSSSSAPIRFKSIRFIEICKDSLTLEYYS